MTHTEREVRDLHRRLIDARQGVHAAAAANQRAIYDDTKHKTGSPAWRLINDGTRRDLEAALRVCVAVEDEIRERLLATATPEPPAEVAAAVSGFGPRYRHVSEIERQYQEAHQLRRDIERGDV